MTTADQEDSDGTRFESPRPLRLTPELPNRTSRKALVTALTKRGMAAESAKAVANAVVQPELANKLLNSPTSFRVPGAELLTIRVDVFTSRVIADPNNPRILNDIIFPAALEAGSDQRALFVPLEPAVATDADFEIRVEGLDQLVWQLDLAMAAAIEENTPRPPIGEQGVMEPPLGVPARIVDGQGVALMGAVLVREGSTRVSHAQSILGLGAADMLGDFQNDKSQKQLIQELNQIAQSSASTITDEDAGRIRVATMPMDLVIGVLPDPDSATTLGDAVDAKVAQDHLNHKKEWKPAAKEVTLGERCLMELDEQSLLSSDRRQWLAGRFSSNQTVDGKKVYEDDRWAALLWTFTTKEGKIASAVRGPIASMRQSDEKTTQIRVREDKIPLAVALSMRGRRGCVTEREVDRESKLLQAAVPPVVLQTKWKPTGKSVDDLAAAALEGLERRETTREGAELAARAVWYLAKHGQISMPRNDLGADGDRRTPADLVAGMLDSARGIRQLAECIKTGRMGEGAGLVLDADGNVDKSGVGKPVLLSNSDVRDKIVPKSGPPSPPPRNPREEYMDAIAAFGRSLREAQSADTGLREILDEYGRPMFEEVGVAPAQIEDFKGIINELEEHLDEYAMNRRVADKLRQQSSEGQPDEL